MVKKIGKKKLLTLLTVAAVVVTMAGSYAMWDQLTAKGSKTLTLDKPVTSTVTMAEFSKQKTLNAAPIYTTTTTFKTTNLTSDDAANLDLTLTPKIETAGETKTDLTDQFDITITPTETGQTALVKEGGSYKDDSVTAGDNAYTVTLTPNTDAENSGVIAAAGTELNVTIEGALSTKTTI